MAIKTYNRVDHTDDRISFRISRMEDIYDERGGNADVPHRHDYYTIVFPMDAEGRHIIDFRSFDLRPSQVFFIAPGQVHQVIENKRSVGFAILFSPEFLMENNIPFSFVDDLNLFRSYGDTPPMELSDAEVKELSAISEEMMRITSTNLKFKEMAIGSYLKLFLIRCNNLCTLDPVHPQEEEAGNTILKKFRELVEIHHTEDHQASMYAARLSVTPDHLNRVVRSLIGKNAKEMIQDRIVLSAKRMLYFTDLTAKEIGFRLGFNEPANFSAFFKKETGLSPSAFRENNR